MENYNNKTVCVTGGTGFIALCLVKRLLEKGYIVHTTVRDPGNTQKVQSLIQLPGASSRLKIFKADLFDDGSFDDAIAGCDGVFHVASPVTFSEKDPENEVIKPAVKGTLNVLEACRKAGTVKRVIVTGSASALLLKESHEKDEVVDESSWSDLDFLQTKRPHRWGYAVAKTRSEQTALEYGRQHGLHVATLVPRVVVGPWMTSDAPLSVVCSLGPITGNERSISTFETMYKAYGCLGFVHVEDVCDAHVFLYETETCDASRYVCNAVTTSLPKLANFLREKYPQYYKGPTEFDMEVEPIVHVSSKKLLNAGFSPNYQTLDKVFEDMMNCFIEKGLL